MESAATESRSPAHHPSPSAAIPPSPRPSRFRFKSRHTSAKRSPSHHHRHNHRSKRRRHHSPSLPNSFISNLSPETAFRESLFDALADDEGAAFWETVYGQPVPPRPVGQLEQMTDDEYAAYVRAKMWERSPEFIESERRRRHEERKRREKQEQDEEARARRAECEADERGRERERKSFMARVDERLRAGERRRREKEWKKRWEEYETAWTKTASSASSLQEAISWPTFTNSSSSHSLTRSTISEFYKHCPAVSNGSGSMLTLLKSERVRWHPDKLPQRFGADKVDEETRQKVTSVFQIIDDVLSEEKKTTRRRSR